jgi:hypothetical protein
VRILDVLLLLVNLPLLVWLVVMRRAWPSAWIPMFAVALGVAGLHLAVGAPPWQMIPAYAVTVALAGAGLLRGSRSRWAGLTTRTKFSCSNITRGRRRASSRCRSRGSSARIGPRLDGWPLPRVDSGSTRLARLNIRDRRKTVVPVVPVVTGGQTSGNLRGLRFGSVVPLVRWRWYQWCHRRGSVMLGTSGTTRYQARGTGTSGSEVAVFRHCQGLGTTGTTHDQHAERSRHGQGIPRPSEASRTYSHEGPRCTIPASAPC